MRSQTKVKAPSWETGGHSRNTDQRKRSTPIVADTSRLVTVAALVAARECSAQCLCSSSPAKGCKCACSGSLHGALTNAPLVVGEAAE